MSARKTGRLIAAWLQSNIEVADELLHAAGNAWRSCQVADGPDNRPAVAQRLHRQALGRFFMLHDEWMRR